MKMSPEMKLPPGRKKFIAFLPVTLRTGDRIWGESYYSRTYDAGNMHIELVTERVQTAEEMEALSHNDNEYFWEARR